jgi:regulator of protease activity HflC (stomatin/prohibitin superfamily)
LILWTNRHSSDPHVEVLVATPKLREYLSPGVSGPTSSAEQAPKQGFAQGGEAVPVSLLRVAANLQYKIRDAYQWITTYGDPESMLEAIAAREIMRHCASADVPNLLGIERGRVERALWETIQKAADAKQLGVEISFLGLQGVHPPDDVAEAFQDVIGAEQKKQATINSAWSEERKRLTEVAGDVGRARQLAAAIREVNRLDADESASGEDRQAAHRRLRQLFFGDAAAGISPVGGQAAGEIVAARTARWDLENHAHGEAAIFREQIKAKNAAEQLYRLRRWVEAYVKALPAIRKYVIAVDAEWKASTIQLNLQDLMTAPLDVALEEESK